MTLDVTGDFSVGTLVDADGTTSVNSDVYQNLLYGKGQQAGQTEVAMSARLRTAKTFYSSTAEMEIRKDWDSGADKAYIDIVAKLSDRSINNGDTVRIELGREGTFPSSHVLAMAIEAVRTSQGTGRLNFIQLDNLSVEETHMSVNADNEWGIGKEPTPGYIMDIDGDVNVSSGKTYYRDLDPVENWTDVAGTATYSDTPGDITVGKMSSTQVSGAPIVAVSTEECPNLDAETLEGLQRTRLRQGSGSNTVDGTGVNCGGVTLNRTGLWEIHAIVSFGMTIPVSASTVCEFKLNDGTSDIGRAATATVDSVQRPAFTIVGNYTSVTGTETIRVLGTRSSGTGEPLAITRVNAKWRGQP